MPIAPSTTKAVNRPKPPAADPPGSGSGSGKGMVSDLEE